MYKILFAELLNEMYRQVRDKSNFNYLNFEKQKERCPTRGKTRGTILKRKHWSNVMKNALRSQIRKAYNFAKENEYFKKYINKMSNAENRKFFSGICKLIYKTKSISNQTILLSPVTFPFFVLSTLCLGHC